MGCFKLTYQNDTELTKVSTTTLRKGMTSKKSKNKVYSSSLIGMNIEEKEMTGAVASANNHIYSTIGKRQYELSNHLGNVLSVISDRKYPIDATADGEVDYYEPDILLTYDYSPFGVILKERNHTKEVCYDTTYLQLTTDQLDHFSDGTTDGWSASNTTTELSNANNRLKAKDPSGGGAHKIKLKKELQLQANTTYNASLEYNVDELYGNPANNNGTKGLRILIKEVATNTTVYNSGYITDVGSATHSYSFTSLSIGAYKMVVQARKSNGNNHNFDDKFFTLDNVSMTHQRSVDELVCNEYGNGSRIGFNGMEKDDEIKGNGNSYDTPNRAYDSRLGRWLSIDPVTHHSLSPYNSFDNNPIIISDPSGADGGGTLQGNTWFVDANLKFQFDPSLFQGMTQVAIQTYKNNYIDNAMNSVTAAWHGQLDANGNQVDATYINFEEVPWGTDVSTLGVDDNLITVGNQNTAQEAGISSYMIANDISHVNGLGQDAKTAFFFSAHLGTETGHEIGHMLGLSDRYTEALGVSRVNSLSHNITGRVTIPMRIGDEQNAGDYVLNTMATSGTVLTPSQIGIAMDRNQVETNWQPYGVLLPAPNARMNDLPGGFNYGGIDIQGGNFEAINIIDEKINVTKTPDLYSSKKGKNSQGKQSIYFTTGSGAQRTNNKNQYDGALESQTKK